MGSFLAKTAFNIAGRAIPWRAIMYLILAIIIAVILWLAYDKVHDHFQHISQLEKDNAQLVHDNGDLQSKLTKVEQINSDNEKTHKANSDQQQSATKIANDEDDASHDRDLSYKELQDEIRHMPLASNNSVDPVITRTADRLWSLDPDKKAK